MLRQWVEQLRSVTATAEQVAPHVADTISAFLAGSITSEGQALIKLHDGKGGAADYAAMLGAVTRLTELDDIDLESCITPGAGVVSAALAVARFHKIHPANWHRAIAAGYAAGMQFGMAMGGANILSAGIWPSGVAAPVIGAVTASILRGQDAETMAHAMSLALASVTARVGRAAGTPSSRWYLFGTALGNGVRAAEAAAQGFKADLNLLNPDWIKGLTGRDNVPGFDFTATPPSITRVGFKPFATARQCANALWAFRSMLSHGLDPASIDKVEIFVPPMNVALIQRPAEPGDRLSTISNAGLQIAIAAIKPKLLYDTSRADVPMERLVSLAAKVTVAADPTLDAYLPTCWAARVVVTAGGQTLEETVVQAPFDADGPGLLACLEGKWEKLPIGPPEERHAIHVLAAAKGVPDAWPLIEKHLKHA